MPTSGRMTKIGFCLTELPFVVAFVQIYGIPLVEAAECRLTF